MRGYAERCAEIDHAYRVKAGPGWVQSTAWVGVNFAKPETEAERRALALLRKRFPTTYSLHVYRVVEILAELIEDEADDHRARVEEAKA